MKQVFVSRAYEKLAFGLDYFKVSVKDLTCADFGSSTGGFVECLLENGATKIYSVDTSYGELAWKLRKNAKVNVLERTNAIFVKLPEIVDFISLDTSWTKLEKVVPNAMANLKVGGNCMALLKPQYEADKSLLKQGTVAEDELANIVNITLAKLKTLQHVKVNGIVASPILGERGKNKEFLIFLSKA